MGHSFHPSANNRCSAERGPRHRRCRQKTSAPPPHGAGKHRRRALTIQGCFSVGFVVSCLQTAGAATLVVSPDGDDQANGSRTTPFRTIGRAAAAMRAGDVCLVRAGVYRETVRPTSSGEAAKPVVFRNWPGERPVIAGGDPVTDWERVNDNIWRASISWDLGRNNQVFIDGTAGQEARWPTKTNDDPLAWARPRSSGDPAGSPNPTQRATRSSALGSGSRAPARTALSKRSRVCARINSTRSAPGSSSRALPRQRSGSGKPAWT